MMMRKSDSAIGMTWSWYDVQDSVSNMKLIGKRKQIGKGSVFRGIYRGVEVKLIEEGYGEKIDYTIIEVGG